MQQKQWLDEGLIRQRLSNAKLIWPDEWHYKTIYYADEMEDALAEIERLRATIDRERAEHATYVQYPSEVRRTSTEGQPLAKSLCVGGLGLTGEAGEVADLIKKHVFHGHELDRDALRKEMGDVLWYLTFLCNTLDMSPSEVIDANVRKLRLRYPDGWDQARSINRTTETEEVA